MKPTFDSRRMVFLVSDPDFEAEHGDLDEENALECFREGEQLRGILLLPAQYEVCGRCSGKGTHWHPSLDNGITEEDRDRDWDPESWEWLMNGGMDVRCEECKGERLVPVPQDSVNSPEAQKAFQIYNNWLDEERDYQALCESERRMGC